MKTGGIRDTRYTPTKGGSRRIRPGIDIRAGLSVWWTYILVIKSRERAWGFCCCTLLGLGVV
jgi:hypothetical protein